MTPIKLQFMKPTNSLIFLLISILGFTLSCTKVAPIVESGPPHAYLIVKGTIKSAADNKLIPDMFIEMRSIKINDSGQSKSRLMDTDFSDTNGNYRLSDIYSTVEDHIYQIRFTDTDGTFNGQYKTLDTMIVFKHLKYIGEAGHWSLHSVEQELTIKLKPKP